MYRQPYHIRKGIKEKLWRSETLYIIEKSGNSQDWVSHVAATPKSNGKAMVLLR